MTKFDNVETASAFVGTPVGQLISKQITKAYTIWVYENAVIKIQGKKEFYWTPDGGQELFFLKNKMTLDANYVETGRMQLAKEYMSESAKVYKGFRSIRHDQENGIVRDYSKVNAILAALGSTLTLGPKA